MGKAQRRKVKMWEERQRLPYSPRLGSGASSFGVIKGSRSSFEGSSEGTFLHPNGVDSSLSSPIASSSSSSSSTTKSSIPNTPRLAVPRRISRVLNKNKMERNGGLKRRSCDDFT